MPSIIPAPYRLTPEEFVNEFGNDLEVFCPKVGIRFHGDPQQTAADARKLKSDTHGVLTRVFSDDVRADYLPDLRRMEFFDPLDLLAGFYREVHTTGMKKLAMNDSFLHLEEQVWRPGVSFGRIVFKTGQRDRSDKLDGSPEMLRRSPMMSSRHPLAALLRQNGLNHEFDLALLAALEATRGGVQLVRGSIEDADHSLEPEGVKHPRSMASCRLRMPSGVEVLMINVPAVPDNTKEAGYRPPSARDVTVHYNTHYWDDQQRGGTFGLRTGMTHGRVGRDTAELLRQKDKDLAFAATCRGADDETVLERGLDRNAIGELCESLIRVGSAA